MLNFHDALRWRLILVLHITIDPRSTPWDSILVKSFALDRDSVLDLDVLVRTRATGSQDNERVLKSANRVLYRLPEFL